MCVCEIQQVGNALFVDCVRRHFKAHEFLLSKPDYPLGKSHEETICETALRDGIHLTELNLSFHSRVGNTLFLGFAKAYLGAH